MPTVIKANLSSLLELILNSAGELSNIYSKNENIMCDNKTYSLIANTHFPVNSTNASLQIDSDN